VPSGARQDIFDAWAGEYPYDPARVRRSPSSAAHATAMALKAMVSSIVRPCAHRTLSPNHCHPLGWRRAGQATLTASEWRTAMTREIIRVEPLSTYLEAWKAPTSVVTRHGDTIYVSGLPPFDPETGTVVDAPIERQTELVLKQLQLCLETAGSSLDKVLKCNVYCTSVESFAAVNAIYARYFPVHPPARIFVCVPAWPGRFDIEIDCIAAA